jgi:WD40 repeat protein
MLIGPASSGGVTAVAFASDGTLAAGYGNGDSYVWAPFSQSGDASIDLPTISYADYGSAVTSVAWAGTGTLATTPGDDYATLAVAHADGQVPITSWIGGQPNGAAGNYAIAGSAAAVGWTTTGGDNMLAAGGANGTAYVWDDTAAVGPAKDAGLRGVSVTALSFVPGGAMLAAGGSDGKVRLWKVTPYR